MLRKAQKISWPLPLVSGESHKWWGGGHIFGKIRAGARIFRRVRIFCYNGGDFGIFEFVLCNSTKLSKAEDKQLMESVSNRQIISVEDQSPCKG